MRPKRPIARGATRRFPIVYFPQQKLFREISRNFHKLNFTQKRNFPVQRTSFSFMRFFTLLIDLGIILLAIKVFPSLPRPNATFEPKPSLSHLSHIYNVVAPDCPNHLKIPFKIFPKFSE